MRVAIFEQPGLVSGGRHERNLFGESKQEKSPISAKIIAPMQTPMPGMVFLGGWISSIIAWMAVSMSSIFSDQVDCVLQCKGFSGYY